VGPVRVGRRKEKEKQKGEGKKRGSSPFELGVGWGGKREEKRNPRGGG